MAEAPETSCKGRVLKKNPTIDPDDLGKWKAKAQARMLPAESLQDGSWLLAVGEENFQMCSEMSKGRPAHPPRALTWGSCCSGTEGARFCCEAINAVYQQNLRMKPLRHKFSCELNSEKQNWIAAVDRHASATMRNIARARAHSPARSAQENESQGEAQQEEVSKEARSPSHCSRSDTASSSGSSSAAAPQKDAADAADAEEAVATLEAERSNANASDEAGVAAAEQQHEHQPVCVFRDILQMGDQTAECAVHNRRCAIPAVDLLILGTSCKDMSRANPAPPKGHVLRQEQSKGGSAQTYRGFLHYLDSRPSPMIIFENVDAMDDAKENGESNLDIFLADTSNRGYESQIIMTDAQEFGLPARRRRIYVLLVRTSLNPLLDFQMRPLAGMFATFGALMHGCLRAPPCATSLWLEADDPAVTSELHAREEKRANERLKKEKEKEKKDKAQQQQPAAAWVDQHMQFAKNLKRRWGVAAPKELQQNPWFRVLTQREQDMLPHLQAENSLICLRDLSQSINRANVGSWNRDRGMHLAPTVLPRQQLWIEPVEPERCRLLLGREALLYQGFPAIPFLEVLQEETLASLQKQAAARKGYGPQAAAIGLQAASPWQPSEALMQDLAGNAMALPVVLSLLQCMFTALSWKAAEPDAATAEDSGILLFIIILELHSALGT